jgi:photosystem II stability/assembly factor-like uncharacterized protein
MKATFTLLFILVSTFSFAQQGTWQKLATKPYPGKQDDICFVNAETGFYANGQGKFYATTNGGTTWELRSDKPGTFWRCLGFADSLNGFAGNVGTDYFPNVSDTIPLYRTTDGGRSWSPANVIGNMPKGLCAIWLQNAPFVNHGKLDNKQIWHAAGRVGSPAYYLRSTDGGNTWISKNLGDQCQMIFDIVFTSEKVGFICAGSNADVTEAHAVVLKTIDGGNTWKKVYESKGIYEMTWKASFPTKNVGYVSIQNYNPDTSIKARYIIKTTDAGETWKEVPLDTDFSLNQYGIGFIDEQKGWVGTTKTIYETADGGKTWKKLNIGRAINKFRVYKGNKKKTVAYAIGVEVLKWEE